MPVAPPRRVRSTTKSGSAGLISLTSSRHACNRRLVDACSLERANKY